MGWCSRVQYRILPNGCPSSLDFWQDRSRATVSNLPPHVQPWLQPGLPGQGFSVRLSGQLLGDKDLLRTGWFSHFQEDSSKVGERPFKQALPTPQEASHWGCLCLETVVRGRWPFQGLVVTVVGLSSSCIKHSVDWGSQVPRGEEEKLHWSAYCVQTTSRAVQSSP